MQQNFISMRKPNRPKSNVNIAKGTTDPRVEFCIPKELLLGISQILTQILIKQLQNLDQAPTSIYQPNISISTKLKLKNLDQT